MKKKDAEELQERYDVCEKKLRELCNYIMKIRRQASKQGLWFSAGSNPYAPLTDEAQQGPMVNKLYEKVEEARKIVRKI